MTEKRTTELTREEAETRLEVEVAQGLFNLGVYLGQGKLDKLREAFINYAGFARTLEQKYPGIRNPYDRRIKRFFPEHYWGDTFDDSPLLPRID